jgi:hypothetical protein
MRCPTLNEMWEIRNKEEREELLFSMFTLFFIVVTYIKLMVT